MSAGPRVLHLVHHLRDTGNGIVNAAVDLAVAHRAMGAEVAVASAGGRFEALLAERDVRHFRLEIGRRPLQLARAFTALNRIVADFRPDIVHAHMVTASLLAFAARVGADFRVVTTVHNEFQTSAVLMALADRVIALSPAGAAALRRRWFPAARLRVVRNGPLGTARAPGIAELEAMPLQHPAILAVGGLYRRKGLDVLIRAFHAIAPSAPTAHLYLVGDGPDRALFERLAAEGRGAARIHFEGFQPAPQRYMLGADIFALPSQRDPFPLVLAEAREAGAAIVASDVDGVPEALEHGRAGLLVPAGDANALARALQHLLGDPGELAAARARASADLGWLTVGRMARETLQVYRELAPSCSPARTDPGSDQPAAVTLTSSQRTS